MNACFRIFCFVDNIKIRRQIFIGLPLFGFEKNVLYFSGFSNVIRTRETGTQHMLLIDPDDEEEEHGRKYKKG